MKKKYMGIQYSVTTVGTRVKWSVADGGLFSSGFADTDKQAQAHAESYIKGKKK